MDDFILKEFDLIGVMKRQTSFIHHFDDKLILAKDQSKLRYLLTPEAKQYLEWLEIIEILDNHKCITCKSYKINEVKMNIRGVETNLFEIMYDMKQILNAQFEF